MIKMPDSTTTSVPLHTMTEQISQGVGDLWWVIILVVLVLIAAAGGYIFFQQQRARNSRPKNDTQTPPQEGGVLVVVWTMDRWSDLDFHALDEAETLNLSVLEATTSFSGLRFFSTHESNSLFQHPNLLSWSEAKPSLDDWAGKGGRLAFGFITDAGGSLGQIYDLSVQKHLLKAQLAHALPFELRFGPYTLAQDFDIPIM